MSEFNTNEVLEESIQEQPMEPVVAPPAPQDQSVPEKAGEKSEAESSKTAQEKPTDTSQFPQREREERIVSITGSLQVETEEQKLEEKYLDLVQSLKTGSILTDTIRGVERLSSNPQQRYAVLYHGDYKIVIPAADAILPPQNLNGRDPTIVRNLLLNRHLGAQIDYIVTSIDESTQIASASRIQAMQQKAKDFYFRTDRDDNYILHSGRNVEARIVSVMTSGIIAEIFGVETYIHLRELSYSRMADATENFAVGNNILVKLLKVDRSDPDHIKVSASAKQATENPAAKAIKRYTPGNNYLANVTMINRSGVFVALDDKVDCLCSFPEHARPPRGAKVLVRISGVNEQENLIWGRILRIVSYGRNSDF